MNLLNCLMRLLSLSLLCLSFQCFAEEAGGHHEFDRNVLALEVGLASDSVRNLRDRGLAVGAAYERRLNERFGIGGLVERTWGDFDFWVYAVAVSYRIKQWKFFVAPGIEDPDDHSSETLLRIGGEYAFDMGGWELAPQIKIDFVNGEKVYLAGFAFGWGF
jgi:hypothetical protein